MEGGITDLPQRIIVPAGFRGFLKQLVEDTHYGLYSSMNVLAVVALLQRLLPWSTLKSFLYIAGADNPKKNDPYPNRAELLKLILGSPRERSILWNQTIVLLELDPLKWPHARVVGPSILARDDLLPLRWERPCYGVKELIAGT